MLKSESRSIPSVFVPVTDELIFDTPELIEGPLVPYSSGMACHGWLSIELNPEDDLAYEHAQAQQSSRGLLHKVSNTQESSSQKGNKSSTSGNRPKLKLAYSS